MMIIIDQDHLECVNIVCGVEIVEKGKIFHIFFCYSINFVGRRRIFYFGSTNELIEWPNDIAMDAIVHTHLFCFYGMKNQRKANFFSVDIKTNEFGLLNHHTHHITSLLLLDRFSQIAFVFSVSHFPVSLMITILVCWCAWFSGCHIRLFLFRKLNKIPSKFLSFLCTHCILNELK